MGRSLEDRHYREEITMLMMMIAGWGGCKEGRVVMVTVAERLCVQL